MSAMYPAAADAGMLSLRQEALQRVRQMQQRARLAMEGSPGGAPPAAQPVSSVSVPPAAQPAPAAPVSPPGGRPPQEPFAPADSPARGEGARPGPPQGPRAPAASSFAGQGRQRPAGAENLLSQLFGGARQQPRGQPAGGAHPPGRQGGANGFLDLIRGGLGGGEAAGLGDSLRGSIASASKPLSDLLDALSIDGEKLLILLVMWVIFNERSDNKTLLLALGYLLL